MKFIQRGWYKYSRIGKKRKKKQVWRKPTGRHNKMREKRKGAAAVVSIGYGTKRTERGMVSGQKVVQVRTENELRNVGKGYSVIFGKVGAKKKLELVKIAKELNLEILNVNTKKLIRKNERKMKLKSGVKKTEIKKNEEIKEKKE